MRAGRGSLPVSSTAGGILLPGTFRVFVPGNLEARLFDRYGADCEHPVTSCESRGLVVDAQGNDQGLLGEARISARGALDDSEIIFTPRRNLKCFSIAAQEEALALVWPRFCRASALREWRLQRRQRRRRRPAASRTWTGRENPPAKVSSLL